MDNQTFSDRLRKIIDLRFGAKDNALATACDVTPSAVSKWLSGTMPSSRTLLRISQASNVSHQWLVTGEGPMFPEDAKRFPPAVEQKIDQFMALAGDKEAEKRCEARGIHFPAIQREGAVWLKEQSAALGVELPLALREALKSFLFLDAVYTDPPHKFRPLVAEALREARMFAASEADFVMVPLYDVEVSAGPGSIIDSEQIACHLAFRREWIVAQGLSAKDLAAVTVKGDSMNGTLENGDTVLLDRSKTDIVSDAIYVLADTWGLKIKRIQRLLNGDLIVKSDNTLYNSETLSPADQEARPLSIFGRVVWFGRLVH